MQITLNLTDEAAQDYAAFYSWNEDSSVSLDDFVTNKLLERVANDVTEQRNRTALAGVASVEPATITEADKSGKTQGEVLSKKLDAATATDTLEETKE